MAWVVLTAAGSGTRLGASVPKALVEVAGRPLVVHALERALEASEVEGVVVTCPAGLTDVFREAASGLGLAAGSKPVLFVEGGASRRESVAAGVGCVATRAGGGGEPAVVLVHDAARAFAPSGLYDSVARRVDAVTPGVVPALAVTDTIKLVGTDAFVESTLPRERLRAVQTPQAFSLKVLVRAHERARGSEWAGSIFTDDASMLEALGERVAVVDGDPRAFKVTSPQDLAAATAAASEERRGALLG